MPGTLWVRQRFPCAISMTNKKKTAGRLGRMAAPATRSTSAPPGSIAPADPELSTDTVNVAVSRPILLRIKRYALILQEQGGPGTQRSVAERMLNAYLDDASPPIDLPRTELVVQAPSGTIALGRALVLRLKRYTLDLEEQLGRTVAMREVADAIFNAALKEAGIPAGPEQPQPGP